MLHKKFYKVLCVVLAVMFIVMFEWSHYNYMDLLSVNNDMTELLDASRENHEEVVAQWEDSYSSLQSEYGALLAENDRLKKSLKDTVLPEYQFSEKQVKLLAKCVQCKAGEKNEQAQRLITKVILNRLESSQFEDTIEKVIYEKVNGCPQFSVAYNGMMDDCTLSPTVLVNVYSVIVCGSDLPDYVLYFYSASLKEDNWIKSLNVYDTVEGTVFAYEKGE